jgi:predicted  nucleic acid-binding Zn-ribbon protein
VTDTESDVLVQAMKATVKRVAAENTWLRHSLMEMEQRVAAMKTQLTQLEARAREARKASAPAKKTKAAATKKKAPGKEHPSKPTPAAKPAARKATTKKGNK